MPAPSRILGLLLVGLLPLYPLVPRFPLLGPFGTDDLIPLLVAGACVLPLLRRRVWRWRLPLLWMLGLFVSIATVAAMATATSGIGVLTAVVRVPARFALYAVLFAAVQFCLDGRGRRRLLVALSLVAVFEGAVGVGAYLFKVQAPGQMGMLHYPAEQMPIDGRARVQGTFGGAVPHGHPFLNRANFYSAYLVVGLGALAALLERRRTRAVVAVGAAFVMGGILVSFTRMSLMAAVTMGLTLLLLQRRTWRWVVAAALAVTLAVVVVPALRARFSDFNTDRLQQWRLAARVIAAHPALGVGDGRYLEEAYRLSDGIVVPEVQTPHNSVLYAMASYGVPAGLALMGVYVCALWLALVAWRRRRDAVRVALVATVVAFIGHDFTNNLFFIPEVALVWWLLVAACSGED